MINPYKYDYLIVGAGLYGATFAYKMREAGYRCLVIEKRNHIGGNCYAEKIDGIECSIYGPHIFHTKNKKIWEFVTGLVEFNQYVYRLKSMANGCLFSFPINLMTFNHLWGINTPFEATKKLEMDRILIEAPSNFEEWVISQIGEELYTLFYKGYTTKQWGRDPREISIDVAKRIPIRLDFNDNYYFDPYQGLPVKGYMELFKKLLNGVEVVTADYFSNRDHWDNVADKILFTGKIDEFYNYRFGLLEYRSLNYTVNSFPFKDFQGTSVINYPDMDVPYTRIIEYKHFLQEKCDHTIIFYEIPKQAGKEDIPFYPLGDARNLACYSKYRNLNTSKVIFGGRVAEYKYLDMDKAIDSALTLAASELLAKQTAAS